MVWQDLVLSAGSFVFFLALIPSVIGKDKPAFSTSVMTGSVLAVFTVTYFTLGLWLATFTTSLASILWAILAIQKYNQKKA